VYVDNNLIVSGSVSATGAIGFQTVTGSSAVLSTNTIDLGVARDIGEGTDLFLRVQVGTTFTGLTNLDLEAIVADDAALSVNVTSIDVIKAVPVAQLTAGARFAINLNPQLRSAFTGRRYLGARYTPTGTGTAGTVFADLGDGVQDSGKSYASGFSII
jgi:hypothetical protein